MPEVVQCTCCNPAENLLILPFMTRNDKPFAAVCLTKQVYIKEKDDWQRMDGFRIEGQQIFKADGEPYQLPAAETQIEQVNPSPEPENPGQEEVRPAGRKPAAGTRVDLSRDDYY